MAKEWKIKYQREKKHEKSVLWLAVTVVILLSAVSCDELSLNLGEEMINSYLQDLASQNLTTETTDPEETDLSEPRTDGEETRQDDGGSETDGDENGRLPMAETSAPSNETEPISTRPTRPSVSTNGLTTEENMELLTTAAEEDEGMETPDIVTASMTDDEDEDVAFDDLDIVISTSNDVEPVPAITTATAFEGEDDEPLTDRNSDGVIDERDE